MQVKKTYLRYILPTNFLKISPVSISIVQAVRLTPSTMPTVLGLIKSCRRLVFKERFNCDSPLLIEPPSNRHKHLWHKWEADREGGRDDKGLEELELAGQSHLHNVGEKVNRPELGTDPVGELEVTNNIPGSWMFPSHYRGSVPSGARSRVPEPFFENPSGSLKEV